MPTGPKGQQHPAEVTGNAVRVVRQTTIEKVAGGRASSAVHKLHAASAKRWAKVYRALAK